jgi:hypothetical protein
MLNITSRACQLGASINTRPEKDEDVPACDIPLAGIMLDETELNALVNDPYAHRALFTDRGGHQEPSLPQFEAHRLRDKLEGATVTLSTGGRGRELVIGDAKLKGLTLEPLSGGATSLSLKVQVSGDAVPGLVGMLLNHLNGHITVEIADAVAVEKKADKQLDLPVNAFGEGERPEGTAKPKRGRRRNGEIEVQVEEIPGKATATASLLGTAT